MHRQLQALKRIEQISKEVAEKWPDGLRAVDVVDLF
jgi:hypothetical protein